MLKRLFSPLGSNSSSRGSSQSSDCGGKWGGSEGSGGSPLKVCNNNGEVDGSDVFVVLSSEGGEGRVVEREEVVVGSSPVRSTQSAFKSFVSKLLGSGSSGGDGSVGGREVDSVDECEWGGGDWDGEIF